MPLLITHFTITTKTTTNSAALMTPATITCCGFNSATSRSYSLPLRTPKNDHATALNARTTFM